MTTVLPVLALWGVIVGLAVIYAAIYYLLRWRGTRLARRALRRRGDGSRGILGRRALRVLQKNARRPGRDWVGAREALGRIGYPGLDESAWEAWLEDPADKQWAALAGPGAATSSRLLERVFATAVAPQRDARARARIGAFCARHGLAPDDGATRAVFFLLTGQAGQYRATDPDGSLLAAAYHGAAEATRAARGPGGRRRPGHVAGGGAAASAGG
jgi:hypothetical protein